MILFSTSHDTDSDPISSALVASLLQRYEVSTVFLTCNEAAKSHVGNKHRLVSAFVAEKIPVVITAPYRFPKLFVMLTMNGYYQSLIAYHQKGPTHAAHFTRKVLQTQQTERKGRYHIPVSTTAEGLGLIVYDNGKLDSHDMQQYCYAAGDNMLKRFGSPYEDIWAFGRDMDIMRVEHRLLERKYFNILWLRGRKSVGTYPRTPPFLTANTFQACLIFLLTWENGGKRASLLRALFALTLVNPCTSLTGLLSILSVCFCKSGWESHQRRMTSLS